MIKALTNNYRLTTDPHHGCHTCSLKQMVPFCWCAEVSQTVCTGMTCDHIKEVV